MPLVPRFGISHLPVSMDIEEKAIPRDADNPSNWIKLASLGFGMAESRFQRRP